MRRALSSWGGSPLLSSSPSYSRLGAKRADTCPSRIRSPEQNDLHPALSAHRASPAGRIGTQINKGEALHALRGFLFFPNEGKIQHQYYEEQLNQASCLNFVTNTVVLWNTVYMSAVLDQLKAQGYPVDDADVAHLWPARYPNINPYGKYGLKRRRRIPPEGSPPAEATRFRISLALFFVQLLAQHHGEVSGEFRLLTTGLTPRNGDKAR